MRTGQIGELVFVGGTVTSQPTNQCAQADNVTSLQGVKAIRGGVWLPDADTFRPAGTLRCISTGSDATSACLSYRSAWPSCCARSDEARQAFLACRGCGGLGVWGGRTP
jgi:hypothetical protein